MLEIAIQAAREAGHYLKESVGKVRSIEVKQGEERNLVSEIDKTSEAMIIRTLRSHFPSHAFLAEEGGGAGSSADYTWVIDPLDGTTNFLHGLPIFCVTIAMVTRGKSWRASCTIRTGRSCSLRRKEPGRTSMATA